MKMKRLCDMINLSCGACPYEGMCDPEFCPCFSSVTVAINAMKEIVEKATAITTKLEERA